MEEEKWEKVKADVASRDWKIRTEEHRETLGN